MPVWPKSFHWFALSLRTARAEWQLRQKRGAAATQDATFAALTRELAPASVWRAAGLTSGMTYGAFQSRVPLQRYDSLAPAIARMANGESDVLCAGRCALFVQSSGTSTGEPKLFPLNEAMLGHFRRAQLESLLYYCVRVKHAGIFRGRLLCGGGSTALRPITPGNTSAYAGELTAVHEVALPKWAEKHFYEPGSRLAGMDDWEAKRQAVAAHVRGRDITAMSGLPSWLLTLAAAMRETGATNGKTISSLQALWPNLECCLHRGIPGSPYQDELRALLGPNIKFHEVYDAPEGYFAVQDSEPVAGLRLLADHGIFFEFIPLADYDAVPFEQLGPKAVPLSGVKPNLDYVLVVTTPAGLVRYVVGDVVRFISTQPPRLVYVGRTELRLQAFGESLAEKDVTDALVGLCRAQSWTIVNFHVAPLATTTLTGQQRGRHEWWVELKPGTVATPTGPQMATALDADLIRINPDYAARRRTGIIEAPVVRLVMPGVFAHWQRFHHMWGGEHKVARCRSDRQIADELAQITNFARD